jgi:hypothetical protein
MKLLFHAILVAAVFVSADFYANGGSESRKVLAELNLRGAMQDAKLTTYSATASLRQQVYANRPQLTALKLDD